MFGVNVGALTKLATALVNGDDNVIAQMIERKIESLGTRLINQMISATPVGSAMAMARRADAAIATGGMSELDRMRRGWLTSAKPISDYNKFSRRLQSYFSALSRGASRSGQPWVRSDWAHSRQQWLDEGWKHDWRSQPRDVIGRWIPGRLDYPVTSNRTKSGRVGKPVSRKVLRLRKRQRVQRAVGRRIVRSSNIIMSNWAKDDGD